MCKQVIFPQALSYATSPLNGLYLTPILHSAYRLYWTQQLLSLLPQDITNCPVFLSLVSNTSPYNYSRTHKSVAYPVDTVFSVFTDTSALQRNSACFLYIRFQSILRATVVTCKQSLLFNYSDTKFVFLVSHILHALSTLFCLI
jgi:hypothetical protein